MSAIDVARQGAQPSPRYPALLVLADGESFEGESVGYWDPSAPRACAGEVVFNTALSGYQEILTDPSYAGQIITFTYPHIGNYGVTPTDDEARRAAARGVVVRDLTDLPSNWRAAKGLDEWMIQAGLGGISGIDTRRLTRHLRSAGAVPGAFAPLEGPAGLSEADIRRAAVAAKGTDGCDLVGEVTTPEAYTVGSGPKRVVAYDFGVKTTMLRHLGRLATVTVVPATTSAEEVLAASPDGVFLSNGPGDPAALGYLTDTVSQLLGRVPIFGICLGNQLLAQALGGETFKLEFGHHGANHPVRDEATGKVEITSQNHNYAVADGTLRVGQVTHVNLNDGVIEGFAVPTERAFAVQYHPEAGPGPHDAGYLFDRFAALMEGA